MRRKIGTLFMIFGAVLLIAALSLFAYNEYEDWNAGEELSLIADELDAAIAENGITGANYINGSTEMDMIELDGYLYIGVVSVPSLGLKLPVMSKWSYPGLHISPGRYFGSVFTNDLVICGHNYDAHFGGLKNLKAGDEVYFTDVHGNVYSYEVIALETLMPTDIEQMTEGEWDLTLFTCTWGGASRVTVRCGRV